jgi:hypothetical protein
MKTQNTAYIPGPYEAMSRSMTDNTLVVRTVSQPYREIAVLRDGSLRDYSAEDREAIATAKLFAAAPDLLLALETIEAATNGLSNPLAQEINRTAKVTIAKAEGR